MPTNGIEAAKSRAKIDLHVAAHGPAQVLEPLDECCVSFLSIPFDSAAREHNNTPCPLALLRSRRDRPRHRAAEQRDEVASVAIELHAIPHDERGPHHRVSNWRRSVSG